MIELKREGRTCKVNLAASIGWTFDFTFTCSDDAYAAFLRKDLNDELWNLFKKVREDAYNRGWSDKTKKKPKQAWFSGQAKIL